MGFTSRLLTQLACRDHYSDMSKRIIQQNYMEMNLFLFTIDKSDIKKQSTFINENSVFKSRKLTDEVNTNVKTNKSAVVFYQFRYACKNFTPILIRV